MTLSESPAPPEFVVRWAPKARQVLEKIQDTLQAGESVADADYDDLARGLQIGRAHV